MSLPSPAPILDLIEAFRRSKAMFTAVSLGVFDRLEKAPAGAAALAEDLGLNRDALERLADACAALGLLERRDGVYSNLPVTSAYLCRSSPHTLAGYVLYSNSALLPLWGHLEDAVREGTNRWQQTFGAGSDIFAHFYRNDEAKWEFMTGMHGFGSLSSPAVVAAFDLSRFSRLVDLGGSTGHLAMAARARYPGLRVSLFDLPQVIEAARARGTDGVELISGDFFVDPLPEADLFAMGRIVHDWTEDKIHRLLARIHARLPQGGGLLLAERLLDDDKSGPLSGLLQSLNMLVCTEGKERTLPEYAALLSQAGFTAVQGRRTGAGLDAILALKS